ncbi:hypothetical protein BC829DRAFT_433010 [Chytridium lagenaria]|nr:hypothetical protein BC829DRAFT_433010 [Chytridium lagenaria]
MDKTDNELSDVVVDIIRKDGDGVTERHVRRRIEGVLGLKEFALDETANKARMKKIILNVLENGLDKVEKEKVGKVSPKRKKGVKDDEVVAKEKGKKVEKAKSKDVKVKEVKAKPVKEKEEKKKVVKRRVVDSDDESDGKEDPGEEAEEEEEGEEEDGMEDVKEDRDDKEMEEDEEKDLKASLDEGSEKENEEKPPQKKRRTKKAEKTAEDKSGSKQEISEKDTKEIERLKGYVVKCGVRKIWGVEFKGKNGRDRIAYLRNMLTELGITGRPSLELCKKIKAQREWAQEQAELDASNILDAGRSSRRARTGRGSVKPIRKSDADKELEQKRLAELELLRSLGSPDEEEE